MSAEEELQTIKKSLELLEKVSGMRPQGWISPSMASARTRASFSQAKDCCGTATRDSGLPRFWPVSTG
jgi:hypothetical protein